MESKRTLLSQSDMPLKSVTLRKIRILGLCHVRLFFRSEPTLQVGMYVYILVYIAFVFRINTQKCNTEKNQNPSVGRSNCKSLYERQLFENYN